MHRTYLRIETVLVAAVFMAALTGCIAGPEQKALERGQRLIDEEDYQGAVVAFTELIELQPQLAVGYVGRAGAYFGLEQYNRAITDLDQAARLEPETGGIYSQRALAHYENKDYKQAEADNREALRLDPQNAGAHNNLAWLLATCPQDDIRNGEEAVELANEALRLTRERRSIVYDTAAAAYAEVGDFEEAVAWQERAVNLFTAEDGAHQWPEEEIEKAQQRLELFQNGQPYRE